MRVRERVVVKSPVRENRPPGSARGTRGNPRPYSTPQIPGLALFVPWIIRKFYVQKTSAIPATGAPISFHAPFASAFCPGRTFGNSPAFQRPNQPGAKAGPEGTAESVAGHTSARRSIVLSAPGLQASLRDAGSLGVVRGAEAPGWSLDISDDRIGPKRGHRVAVLWSLDISDGRIWAKWAGFYQAAAAPTIVW